MDFKTVEQDITPILKYSEAARCDDMALYADYVFNKLPEADRREGWLAKIFSNRYYRITHGIAPYETVSRIRRKLQAEYENLRPSQKYKEERKRAEKEYRKYAREGAGE